MQNKGIDNAHTGLLFCNIYLKICTLVETDPARFLP